MYPRKVESGRWRRARCNRMAILFRWRVYMFGKFDRYSCADHRYHVGEDRIPQSLIIVWTVSMGTARLPIIPGLFPRQLDEQ